MVASYAFGLLMNLSGWPFLLGAAVSGHEGSLAYVAGAPLADNLRTFAVYTLLTSTGSWDTVRAITTAVAVVVLGPAILTTLRRASRRATVVGVVAGVTTAASDDDSGAAASTPSSAPPGPDAGARAPRR